MKISSICALAAALVFITAHSSATTLKPGQSIGIDFGATPPTNHFNQFDPSNPATFNNGILSIVQDTNGTVIPGVEIDLTGNTPQCILLDAPQYIPEGFDISNIEDAVTGYNLMMTFAGLDPNQSFALTLVSYYPDYNFGAKFVWETQTITTISTGTSGEALAGFTNIHPDATGKIVISAFSLYSPYGANWSGANAALLTAQVIPEPSIPGLLLIGMSGWLLLKKIANGRKIDPCLRIIP